MAARVQAFQGIPNAPPSNSATRVVPSRTESGVTVGRGRREDANFASPAGRASRDGVDGARGDSRPPVGAVARKLHPSMEEKEVYRRPPSSSVTQRPATSLGSIAGAPISSVLPSERIVQGLVRHKYRSMEHIEAAASEISDARSRLRSIAENTVPQGIMQKDRTYTMAELEDLVETAIEEQGVSSYSSSSGVVSGQATPKVTTIKRRQSERAPRKSIIDTHGIRQPLLHRRNAPSSDSIELPRSSDNKTRIQHALYCGYAAATSQASHHKKGASMNSTEGRAPESQDMSQSPGKLDLSRRVSHTVSHHHVHSDAPDFRPSTSINHAAATNNGPTSYPPPYRRVEAAQHGGPRGTSPVRQRAAMFEDILKNPSRSTTAYHQSHDQHLHFSKERSKKTGIPGASLEGYFSRSEGEHEDDRAGSPLVPLNLPHLASHQDLSDQFSEASPQQIVGAFNTAPKSVRDNQSPLSKAPPVQAKQRISSLSWLPSWSIFNKTLSASMRPAAESVQADRTADQQHPLVEQGVVRTRVQNLLAAVERRDRGLHVVHQEAGKQQDRKSGSVSGSELIEHVPEDDAIDLKRVPPLQLPLEEQADTAVEAMQHDRTMEEGPPLDAEADAVTEGGLEGPRTVQDLANVRRPISEGLPQAPRTQALYVDAEKEVMSSTGATRAQSVRSGSPLKPAPTTPVRGRPKKGRSVMSPGAPEYTMEQHFALSPGPSRSTSRASRGTVRVEIEVRESPEREAKERGEAILIVRANVEAMNMQEEDRSE